MAASNSPSVSVAVAASGDNTLVAAKAGYKIRVLSLCLVATGTVKLQIMSDVGGSAVALTGPFNLIVNGNVTWAPGPIGPSGQAGWCETAAGKALNLNLSGAIEVDGIVTYQYVGT